MRKVSVLFLVGLILTSCYDFNRKQAELDAESKGKQILNEAEYSKQAKIEEAKADFESAKLEAETKQLLADGEAKASITKAKADAEVMTINADAQSKKTKILIDAFGSVDAYLTFLYYSGVDKAEKVYIPTEAGLPLIER